MKVINGAIGGLRLGELTPGVVDASLAQLATDGRDLSQVRAVLSQLLDVAVWHEAIVRNF